MADKSFGIKRLNLIGASGTPTIESPNNLNLNAISVGISTDLTIGGKIESDVIVGSSYSIGVGTANPVTKLHVEGDGYFTGIITAASFSGTISTTSFANTAFNLAGVAATASFATTAYNLIDASGILAGTISSQRLSGTYGIDIDGRSSLSGVAESLTAAENILSGTISSERLSGTYNINITGTSSDAGGSDGQIQYNNGGTTLAGASQFYYDDIDNRVGIGTTAPTEKFHVEGNVYVSSVLTTGDLNSTSDINLKTNIQKIENPLDKIIQVRGVNFEWKKDHRKSVGVVAQELEIVFPELVTDGEVKTVNYNGLIGVLVECIKELKTEINELKKKINN